MIKEIWDRVWSGVSEPYRRAERPTPLPLIKAIINEGGGVARPYPVALCLDLGTSSSAVVWAGSDKQFHRLAVLGLEKDGAPKYTIGSAVLWMDETIEGAEKLVMGAENYAVVQAAGGKLPPITTSLKRMLFDYEALSDTAQKTCRRRIKAMFRELLLLTLSPGRSSTLQFLKEKSAPVTDRWITAGGFGESQVRLFEELSRGGIIVGLCIPNSFGSQPMKVAHDALSDALLEVGRTGDDLKIVGDAHAVHLIREAEAVAWASIDRVRASEHVLVVDVGAGTTDVALVENDREIPRLRGRTGMPFGGDDTDHVFLTMAVASVRQEQPAAAASDAPAPPTAASQTTVIGLDALTPEQKRQLIEAARVEKERWSSNPESRMAAPYLVRNSDQTVTISDADIEQPNQSPVYHSLLRYTISATCGPLLNQVAENGLRLGAIILSGSASFLPGIRETLQSLVQSARLGDVPIQAVAEHLRGFDVFETITPVRQAKLACAWGGAQSKRAWNRPRESGTYLSEAILVRENDSERIRIEAGTTVAHDELTQYFPLDPGDGHTFHFYRFFCPLTEHLTEAERGSSWVRRLIGELQIRRGTVGVGVRFGVSDEPPNFAETLEAWYEVEIDEKKMTAYPPDLLRDPPSDKERNPVTRLPMNWAWPA